MLYSPGWPETFSPLALASEGWDNRHVWQRPRRPSSDSGDLGVLGILSSL